jgi:hypothetical protein
MHKRSGESAPFFVLVLAPRRRTLVTRSVGILLCMFLCACATPFKPPQRPTATEVVALSYERAIKYLGDARNRMDDNVASLHDTDSATKGMVAGGLGGAGIAGLFKAHADVMTSLLTVGGAGYASNQNLQPQVRLAIYRAGLRSLDCIEDAGARSAVRTLRLKKARAILKGEMDELEAAMRAADNAPQKELQDWAPEIAQATVAYHEAQRLDTRIGGVVEIDEATIARDVYSAVNATVASVSEQLDAATPSLDTIAQASSVSAFVSTHRGVKSQTDSTAAAATEALAPTQRTTQLSLPAWLTDIRGSLQRLRAIVAEIQDILAAPVASTSSFAACRTVAPSSEPLIVELPDRVVGSEVTLKPGEVFNLVIAGVKDQTPKIGWIGEEPTISQMSHGVSDDSVQLKVTPTAHPGRYTLYVYETKSKDPALRRSNRVTVNITTVDPSPAAARSPIQTAGGFGKARTKTGNAARGSVSPMPPPPDTISAAGSPARKLTDLGLPVEVKPDDSRYRDRIRKLEHCANLAETGIMSPGLRKFLEDTGPVNANGDCRLPGATQAPAAAAGQPAAAGTPAHGPQPGAATVPPTPSAVGTLVKH